MWAVGGGTIDKAPPQSSGDHHIHSEKTQGHGLSTMQVWHQSSPVPAVLQAQAWTSLHPDALYCRGKEMKTATRLASETE